MAQPVEGLKVERPPSAVNAAIFSRECGTAALGCDRKPRQERWFVAQGDSSDEALAKSETQGKGIIQYSNEARDSGRQIFKLRLLNDNNTSCITRIKADLKMQITQFCKIHWSTADKKELGKLSSSFYNTIFEDVRQVKDDL